MNTASFKLSKLDLFELIGMPFLLADIQKIEVYHDHLKIFIAGIDSRIPEGENFEESYVIHKKTEAYFKKIEV